MSLSAPLPPGVNGSLEVLPTAAGHVAFYAAYPDGINGQDSHNNPAPAPMLFVHSVNAAGSAAEIAPLFDHYRRSRSVYALDLPGFGLSERSDRKYLPRLMTDAILACLERIRTRHGGAAVHVVALSLSGEFAARAQLEHPQLFRTLVLISPTGFNGKPRRYGPAGATLGQPWLYALLGNPLWRDAVFRGLTRPSVIRYFLQRTWGSKKIDEALWHYDTLTTRESGAAYAPLYFLAAFLFSRDINALYEALQCPVWVSMATRGDFINYQGRYTVEGRSNWQFHCVDGGALPFFEDLDGFVARLDPFLVSS